MLTIVIQTANT